MFGKIIQHLSVFCLECANRTYGVNCENKCGQCRQKEDCDPISGLCTLGCDPGWQGLRCQQSKLSNQI